MPMNYTSLVAGTGSAGSIANWVLSSHAQAAAPTIVEEAESFIYRRLRHWRMIAETTGTMTAGNTKDFIDISGISNYLEDKTLRFVGLVSGTVYNHRVRRKTMEEVKAAYGYDGTGGRVQQLPSVFYNNGTQIKFDSPVDLAYPWELAFYQQPAALGTATTTNWVTGYYPRMMRAACMIGACEYMKDAGQGNFDRTYWINEAEKEIALAQAESDLQSRSMETEAEYG